MGIFKIGADTDYLVVTSKYVREFFFISTFDEMLVMQLNTFSNMIRDSLQISQVPGDIVCYGLRVIDPNVLGILYDLLAQRYMLNLAALEEVIFGVCSRDGSRYGSNIVCSSW